MTIRRLDGIDCPYGFTVRRALAECFARTLLSGKNSALAIGIGHDDTSLVLAKPPTEQHQPSRQPQADQRA